MVCKKTSRSKVNTRNKGYKRQLKVTTVTSDIVCLINKGMIGTIRHMSKVDKYVNDYRIIQNTLKRLVSKVSRLDYERRRQSQIRLGSRKTENTNNHKRSVVL